MGLARINGLQDSGRQDVAGLISLRIGACRIIMGFRKGVGSAVLSVALCDCVARGIKRTMRCITQL
jgi:hypothetical protein